MQNVFTTRQLGIGLGAILLVTAGLTASAGFAAPAPGTDLHPIDGAGALVDLVQGQEAILWSSLSGPVTGYTVLGWPTRDDGTELGGALVIERLDRMAGVIDIGEKPRSVEFTVNG
jgi:hypothetical protein